jgi:hypothetical protein
MALDFLFQGEALPNVTTSSTAEQFGPAWYQQYLGQLFGRTSSIAGEPYQAYTGQRVAGLTPDQTNAYGTVRDNMGKLRPRRLDRHRLRHDRPAPGSTRATSTST